MFLLETNNILAVNTGLQSSLKSGSFVSFTVNKKIDTNVYKILLLGKYFNVKSTKILKEGVRINAQIFWDKSNLQLRVLEKKISGTENPANLLNMRNSVISEELIKSNMPFDPSYFKIMEPLLPKNKKSDYKFVKILLLLIDKGIPVNDNNIKEILNFSDLGDDGKSKNQNRNGKREKNNIEIKQDIKKQINKTDTGNDLLKYFNHSVAKHDNWLIIPLKFSFKRPGKGVLKLKLDKSLKITNFVLNLEDGNEWLFSLAKSDKGDKMNVFGPEEFSWEESSSFIKLKEKLYNMGIVFDDINKECAFVDGFSGMYPGKVKNIDFTV